MANTYTERKEREREKKKSSTQFSLMDIITPLKKLQSIGYNYFRKEKRQVG
jgi:hypothetical protein